MIKQMVHVKSKEERFQVDFSTILQDHFDAKDPKEAMSLYFDIVLLLMSNEKVSSKMKVKKYSRKVFKYLVKNMKNCTLELNLWWIKKAVTVLSSMPMAFRYLAFFVKLINYSVSKILLPKLDKSSLLDILSGLSFWTLSLELALNIRPRWFSIAFRAIYTKARENKDQNVIDLLLKNHSTVFSAYKANLTAAHPMVAFYQGQYSKAVIKWQEQAIFGNEIQRNLFRISDLFCELGCILELAIFISWTVSNFDKEVFYFLILIFTKVKFTKRYTRTYFLPSIFLPFEVNLY